MKLKHTCEECGGAIEAYRLGFEFCSRCGGKRETYFIDNSERCSAEMSSASAALSFVGILSGFVFAILLVLLKPQLVGLVKALTYFTLISSLCILLFLCFFLLHTVRTLKSGYVHALHWFRDVLHILYVPFGLILLTLTVISGTIHWGYAVLCVVAAGSMFALLRYKLGYEESIQKFLQRISKAGRVTSHDIGLAEQWIEFLVKNDVVDTDESSELMQRLSKLKAKSSEQENA
jgi:hypothetical protein